LFTIPNLLIVLYYFVPIWAFLIWRYLPLKGTYTLAIIEFALFFLTVWLAWNPMRLPKITSWLHYYTFFLMSYIFIFTVKFGHANLNKIVALGLWMIFIAGDWWEYPVFVYDGFGWLNGWHVWTTSVTQWISSHIHRAYVLATLLLTVKLAKIQFTKKTGLLAISGTAISFVSMFPWSFYTPLSTFTHITCLSLFAGVIYFGKPTLVDSFT